jgi:hypothetical protein
MLVYQRVSHIRFWLVLGNHGILWKFMTFHSVRNVMIPTGELIFFRGVGQPPTRIVFETHMLSGYIVGNLLSLFGKSLK